VVNKVLNMMVLPECLPMIEGLIITTLVYMNSLEETEGQIEFFELSMGNVNEASRLLLAALSKMSMEELKASKTVM